MCDPRYSFNLEVFFERDNTMYVFVGLEVDLDRVLGEYILELALNSVNRTEDIQTVMFNSNNTILLQLPINQSIP